jgi:DNA polymerase-3 subunit gamma/tau
MSDETNLATKYRAKKFRDIVGQPKAETWFRKQIVSREARSVLISGPIGAGKSSYATVYSKALFCDAPEEGEPCVRCDRCKEFGDTGRGFPDFHRFEAGETSTVEAIKGLVDIARVPPWVGTRRVMLLDEIHNLSRRVHNSLLRIVDHV